jgi:hypothetical protein
MKLKMVNKQETLREFLCIPGVGKTTASDLWDIGLRSIGEFRGRDPEELYERLRALRGTEVDRCMLYVFRCAVYYASNMKHDPELLKWWNWRDKKT